MIWNLKSLAALAIAGTMSLAATAWYAYGSGKQAGKSQIQSLWDADQARVMAAHLRELERLRAREMDLQKAAQRAKEDRDAQVAAARRAAADLRGRLRVATEARDRDDTPGPVAGGGAFAPGSLGALLSEQAPDAIGRLIDEAERAEVIRLELLRMYRWQEDAVQALPP